MQNFAASPTYLSCPMAPACPCSFFQFLSHVWSGLVCLSQIFISTQLTCYDSLLA